jgi:prepilin-type N-terminal cleavage/methylation domain-containing protein
MKHPPSSLLSQKGFTLIELLVALLASSVVMGSLMTFFFEQLRSMQLENSRRTAESVARACLNFIARELEGIGRDPHQTLFLSADPAINAAEADSLHYRTNLSSTWTDNDDDDAWEDVTFLYNTGTQVIEVVKDGTTYSLSESSGNRKTYVPSGGLTFTYYDRSGNVVAAGGDAAQRATIHRIKVVVSVRSEAPPGEIEPTITFSRDVFLRNVF